MNNKLSYYTMLAISSLSAVVTGCACAPENYSPTYGEGEYILTPKAGDLPNINGAEVFGVRPNNAFIYKVPATGKSPLKYEALNLPKGLSIDSKTGLITGVIEDSKVGSYNVGLVVSNSEGVAKKTLEIQVGEEICLTPPLGWNSWNAFGAKATQQDIYNSAKAIHDSGMIDYGWSYINIDDGWQGNIRGGKHHGILSDTQRYPDMKGLVDDIHSLGLKAGIYSSPWITTYAKFIGGSSNNKDGSWTPTSSINKKAVDREKLIGKYFFDENDAKQWADWGFDYLKYDWNPNDEKSTVRMAKALRGSGRDIVYSLSNTCPMELVDVCDKYVHCWRTAGDLKGRWNQKGSHKSIMDILPLHRQWVNEVYTGRAGHFPDPDMLVIGEMNNSDSMLTAHEQYSHISLWAMWAAPMLIGSPVEIMDEFTMSLLTNAEILAIHQDRMAKPAKSVIYNEDVEIMVKELYNGDKAIAIVNMSDNESTITVNFADLGLKGKYLLRDAWRQKDIGVYCDSFTTTLPTHATIVVRAMKE